VSARDSIFKQLRGRAREQEMPPAWISRRDFGDPAGRFESALTAAKGEVVRAPSLAAALDALGELLRELNARTVVANAEPPLSGARLEQRWPELEWHIVGETAGDLRAFCARADVGLSGADAALAETGSIIVSSGPGRSRLATLLPPAHIALLSTSALTTDIFTWTAAREGGMPANVNIISGPSKSADIEVTLAIGVHGPGRFIVILYTD